MQLKQLFGGLLLLISLTAVAKPTKLIIENMIKRQSSDSRINSVHREIPHYSTNLAAIKYEILEGMITTRGYKWVLEGEGDGFVLARFDYRGDTTIIKIEYDTALVQLKYHDAWGDYVCKKVSAGICYKNARGYYNYTKNLRKSIEQRLGML